MQTIKAAFIDPRGQRQEVSYRLDPARHTQHNIQLALSHGRFYESATSQVMIHLLRPGDAAIDIGAHIGYYSMIFSKLVGPSGRVLAFEPNPETFPGLIANVIGNGAGNVYALNCALGGESGVADFFLNDNNEGESALWDVSALERSRDSKRRVSVVVTTLDEIAAASDWTATRLIKLDAEGFETRILAGGAAMFSGDKPHHVICEINRYALNRCGTSELELRRFFDERGYQTYMINLEGQDLCGGKLLRRLEVAEVVETRYVFNLLFSLGFEEGGVLAGLLP